MKIPLLQLLIAQIGIPQPDHAPLPGIGQVLLKQHGSPGAIARVLTCVSFLSENTV